MTLIWSFMARWRQIALCSVTRSRINWDWCRDCRLQGDAWVRLQSKNVSFIICTPLVLSHAFFYHFALPGQGSDFSFNRSWPWSGGLPSTFPAAAAARCWGVVACAALACPWIACGWAALQDYGPFAAAAPGGSGWRPLPHLRRSGGQLRWPCQGLHVWWRPHKAPPQPADAGRCPIAGSWVPHRSRKTWSSPTPPRRRRCSWRWWSCWPGEAPRWCVDWQLGAAWTCCLDLAVTSGMRLRSLAQTAANGQQTVAEYKVKKCSHQNKLASCGTEGLQFLPIVAEACGGGWSPIALQTFKAIATAVAARSNEPAGVEYDRLLQSLSVAMQRKNARAVLRRVPG